MPRSANPGEPLTLEWLSHSFADIEEHLPNLSCWHPLHNAMQKHDPTRRHVFVKCLQSCNSGLHIGIADALQGDSVDRV